MQILLAIILNALALIITAYIVPGFNVSDFTTALLASIVLGIVNTFIRPVLAFVTIPLSLLTLGLFTFVINALMLFAVSYIVPGVVIEGWMAAILAAIVLSITSTVLNTLLKDLKKIKLG